MSVDWENLVHNIAHDAKALVRKGLTNAQFLEGLLGPTADARISMHLGAVIESQVDLNLLLGRLVALADAQKRPLSSKPADVVDLETAVLGAKLDCRDEIQRTGAELIVQDLPSCRVPQRTQLVLRELLTNSLRFASPERRPRVTIQAHSDEGTVRVRVADNGTGLPPDAIGKLFEPLQRLDALRSGPGMGLAISRALVEAAGGRIFAEPCSEGATFVFELPVSA